MKIYNQLLLIVCVLNFNNIKGTVSDSTLNMNKKFEISTFATALNIFDGNGLTMMDFPVGSQTIFPHLAVKYFVDSAHYLKLKFWGFASILDRVKDPTIFFEQGKAYVSSVRFRALTISYGKEFSMGKIKTTTFKIPYSIDVSYRNGKENIYADLRRQHYYNSTYNSVGLGCTTGFKVVFDNRVFLGTDVFYTYFFEKSRLDIGHDTDFYKSYKPRKNNLGVQFIFGILI